MYIGRVAGLILAVLALLPVSTGSQSVVRMDHAALSIFNCLNTGECKTARMLSVGEDRKPYYEVVLRGNGIVLEFVVPVGERRLEVNFSSVMSEITLIDTDIDGIVDHVIFISYEKGTVEIFGQQLRYAHAGAQKLYRHGLDIAMRAFAYPEAAPK